MVNNSVVIPCAVLGAIVGISIIFIWWWFPRAWQKGTNDEVMIRDIEGREGAYDRVAWAEGVLANFKAKQSGQEIPPQPGNLTHEAPTHNAVHEAPAENAAHEAPTHETTRPPPTYTPY